MAPLPGRSVTANTPVTFRARAGDAESGDLGASVVWTSDLQGAIGAGGEIAVRLARGRHLITAAVTDGAGATARATLVLDAVP